MDSTIILNSACVTEKCYIDPTICDKYKLKRNNFCQITFNNNRKICKVRYKHLSSIIECNDMVSVINSTSSATTRGKSVKIHKLPHKFLKDVTVNVNVVIRDSSLSEFQKVLIAKCVKSVLTQIGFVRNSIINCAHIPYCKSSGLEKIIVIDKVIPEGTVFNFQDEDSVQVVIEKLITSTEFTQTQLTSSSKEEKLHLAGVDRQFHQIKDIITPLNSITANEWNLTNLNTNILIHGPPGTGKTTLVKLITKQLDFKLIFISCSTVSRPHPGESVAYLREIFNNAVQSSEDKSCVLFLDEIDCIGSKQAQTTTAQSGILSQLQSILDESSFYPNLAIIGATNKIDSMDPRLSNPKYFAHEIFLGLPDTKQRKEIFELLLKPIQKSTNEKNVAKLDFHLLAQHTPGYSGSDLKLLCHQFQTSHEDIFYLIRQFKPSSRRTQAPTIADSPPVKWEDIGGLDEVKFKLRQMIDLPLNQPNLLKYYGLPYPKGFLLYGPPGCCKTTLIRALANDLKVSFYSINPAQVYSPYLGESEKTVSQVFRQARSTFPSILFIDELDALVGSRSEGHQRGVHEKVLSTLLNEMSGIGTRRDIPLSEGDVIVIAATNRPDLIDSALIRPGRLDNLIYIPPPDKDTRKSILEVIFKKMAVENVDLEQLAEETRLFSGADLENLCREAAFYALEEDGLEVEIINRKHFDVVLKEMSPSIDEEQLEYYVLFIKLLII